MKGMDRIFGWLLVLASLLHAMGSLVVYRNNPGTLLWALSATLAGLLLAALNILRVGRPHDRMLASISFAGCMGWLAVVLAFGVLIGSLLDFRVITQGVVTLVLASFSLRTAVGKTDRSTQ